MEFHLDGVVVADNCNNMDQFFDKFVELIESEGWQFVGNFEEADKFFGRAEEYTDDIQ